MLLAETGGAHAAPSLDRSLKEALIIGHLLLTKVPVREATGIVQPVSLWTRACGSPAAGREYRSIMLGTGPLCAPRPRHVRGLTDLGCHPQRACNPMHALASPARRKRGGGSVSETGHHSSVQRVSDCRQAPRAVPIATRLTRLASACRMRLSPCAWGQASKAAPLPS